jgi:hypothetical protein
MNVRPALCGTSACKGEGKSVEYNEFGKAPAFPPAFGGALRLMSTHPKKGGEKI